jgi:DNA-binding transcriptional ArsR family regulator
VILPNDVLTLSEESERVLVDKLLKGRTMSVYALLLSRGEMGVRDVQRALGFSSPSLALHHLTKLAELDLVEKDIDGVYCVKRIVRVGSLSLFIKLGTRLLPRFLFLGTLFSAMLVVYIMTFATWPLTGGDIMFIALSLLSFNETRRIWLLKPF